MSEVHNSLGVLQAEAQALSAAVLEHLSRWPSSRLAHRLGGLADLQSALRAEVDAVARAEDKAAANAITFAAHEKARIHDSFELEMAAKMGLTVEAFVELQAKQRAEMQDKPPMSYSPDHQVK